MTNQKSINRRCSAKSNKNRKPYKFKNLSSVMDSRNKFYEMYSVYLAQSSDPSLRFLASSGGFCKSFLVYLIDQGIMDSVIITRTGSPENPLVPETIVTSSKKDILSPRTNSIYAPTNPLSVMKDLECDKKYAFVGLGCHIKELVEMQNTGKLRNIELKIGLLCHHTPKYDFTDQILKRLNIQTGDIKQISYRGNGWPGGFTASMKNGDSHFISNDEYWSNDLNNGLKKCISCREVCDGADIVSCDPWNLDLEKTEKIGKTLIFCKNENIDSLVNSAQKKGFIDLFPSDKETAYRSQGKHYEDKSQRGK